MSDYDRVAREKAEALEIALDKEVHALKRRLDRLAGEHDDLLTAVAVLRQVLAETGSIDDKVLQYRIEAAIEESREQRSRPRCTRCMKYREATKMVITADGFICDPSCEALG